MLSEALKTTVGLVQQLLAKIAADGSHSATDFLLNYITIFELTEHEMPLLRQVVERWRSL